MPEVTTMKLGVDLECDRCYKKIKKLLCKFPEIRDQAFFEKENTVTIKVVCCSPDKIRDKLICKGGKTIKSIEIIVPEKTKPPPENPKPPPEKLTPPPPAKGPPPEDSPTLPRPPWPTVGRPDSPIQQATPKPPTSAGGYPQFVEVPLPGPRPQPPGTQPPPGPQPPPPENPDLGHRGPCHHGYGIPHQRPSSYDGYVKLVPSYDESYGGWPSGSRCNRSYGCRCEYFTEENPACTIM